MEKITLGRKYSISSWVEAGYAALVRKGDLTDEETEQLGAINSSRLWRIMLQTKPTSQPPRRGQARSSGITLEEKIRELFQEELGSIAAAEKAVP